MFSCDRLSALVELHSTSMSDDDQPFAGRGVLPVADVLPDGDPMDGSEYLALVRWGLERLELRKYLGRDF